MNGPTWRIDDEDGSPEITGAPRPLLVTGRALRDALVRTWRIWVAATVIGGFLGVAALLALPHPASASTTLLMIHSDPGESAMTTDLNLLQTRAVASRVIADLDLQESPEALLSTVTVTPVNDQILALEMTGPDEASAVARTTSLVDNFLEFRAEQLRSISNGIIEGYENRVADLQSQIGALTREYERLSAETTVDEVRASDVLASRATLGNQLTLVQSAIEDARLQTEAAVTATHVIDAPVPHPFGSRRQLVLFAVSGAILGAAVSTGVILFRTLTSDRLRQRREVAAALGVPVRVGVGPVLARGFLGRNEAALTSRIARLLRGHPVSWTGRRRRRNLEALVQGLELALPPRPMTGTPHRGTKSGHRPAGKRSGPTTLGVAAIDRADTGTVVLRAAADRMTERGVAVLLVDLTTSGALSASPGLSTPPDAAAGSPQVYRPEGDPTLAAGPRRSGRRAAPEPEELGELGPAWDEADLVLALVEVDPGIDLDIVRTWVNRVVPLVSAGRASGELLSTIAGLVKRSGLEMPFALLEGADRSDQTLGYPAATTVNRDETGAAQA
jgi:capsular polysaccharide biosynthesis protein